MLETYDFRDPEQLLREILASNALAAGDVLLVLVRNPSTDQEIRDVARLEAPAGNDPWDYGQVIYAAAERMSVPKEFPTTHSLMVVIARTGWTVLGPEEGLWVRGALFSNAQGVFHGGPILITEHGWTDFDTGWGGLEPRLDGRPPMRAVMSSR